jgi:hypothetical protein
MLLPPDLACVPPPFRYLRHFVSGRFRSRVRVNGVFGGRAPSSGSGPVSSLHHTAKSAGYNPVNPLIKLWWNDGAESYNPLSLVRVGPTRGEWRSELDLLFRGYRAFA